VSPIAAALAPPLRADSGAHSRAARFARFAWGVLGANLAVIAWGAYVRASGAGAGCGSHWPLCNGELVPRAPRVETLIELSHRVSSGVAMALVFGMTFWAFRTTPKGSLLRKGASWASIFITAEALIGAGLVLFKLVEKDASMQRAASISAHLVNTFFLLASLALTAWWAQGAPRVRLRGQGASAWIAAAPLAEERTKDHAPAPLARPGA
jgi:cytochrome c oxidase assembly protein subunit 15/protoheme IX farnesyltransferase